MASLYRLILALILLSSLTSCSKEERWSDLDLYQMGKQIDSEIEIILPKDLASGVQCHDYPPGCLGGKRAKLRRVIMTVVEFQDEKMAKAAAFHIGQYHAKNWVFDDVAGEPVLEDFVQRAYGATKPQSAE